MIQVHDKYQFYLLSLEHRLNLHIEQVPLHLFRVHQKKDDYLQYPKKNYKYINDYQEEMGLLTDVYYLLLNLINKLICCFYLSCNQHHHVKVLWKIVMYSFMTKIRQLGTNKNHECDHESVWRTKITLHELPTLLLRPALKNKVTSPTGCYMRI